MRTYAMALVVSAAFGFGLGLESNVSGAILSVWIAVTVVAIAAAHSVVRRGRRVGR